MVIAPAVLSIAEEVPLVGKAVRVLKKFVAVWEKTKENVEAFNKLREVVDRCVRLLEEYLDTLRSPEISENIKSDMDVLSNRIEESADLLANLARLDEHRTNSCEGFKQLRISPPPSRGHIL
jgi:Na+/phosphate symporter